MVKLVIAIVAILLVVGAGAYFSWSYADYIITGWNWVTTAAVPDKKERLLHGLQMKP